ncbi:hypothetical protein [Xanthomonas phage RTH11]|nr:hypothetical protein [Xanthomonas phage RTH11]
MQRLIVQSLVLIYHHEDPEPERSGWSQHETAYQAIKACLNPSQEDHWHYNGQPNYIHAYSRNGNGINAELQPKFVWKSWEAFEELLKTHILAFKIQRNLDLSQERAAEDLLIAALDNQRLCS